MSFQVIHGDALEVLRRMDSETINTCVTSPPYWKLRDYEVDGQLGEEETYQEYVSKIVEIFREVRRVLRKDGTLWLNLGDSSSAGGRGGGGSFMAERKSGAWKKESKCNGWHSAKGLKRKNLVGIPWRVALAMQDDGWYLRQEIIWSKPNPMPESAKDRPTRSHEQLFLMSRSARYYYDYEAIMEPVTGNAHSRGDGVNPKSKTGVGWGYTDGENAKPRCKQNPSMSAAISGALVTRRNKRSVWTIPTQPFKDAHFATFPEALAQPCVLAGCPVGGVVLDPFCGSGTTGVVCVKRSRNFIGIEIKKEYVDMGRNEIELASRQQLIPGLE